METITKGTFTIAMLLTAIIFTNVDAQEELRSQWKYYKAPELSAAEVSKLALKANRQPEKYIEETNRKIQDLSDKLEGYIHRWLKGEADGKFPLGFFSEWIENEKTHDWQLVKPDVISPEQQWYALLSYDPVKELHQFSPDPHATYLKLIFLAPLGSKLLVEGDFPHARFMDYQIILPIDPMHPQEGMCEVPLVDVDIEPDFGHVNPFRVGADRKAKKRHYHVEFELQAGDAVNLNPRAMIPPQYRAPGNKRVGGPLQINSFYGGNVIVPAVLWLRYYAPDKESGPLGGVPLPEVSLQMASGEKFWITCDKSLAVKLWSTPVPRISITPPEEPYPVIGPSVGWFKLYDIVLSHMEGQGYQSSQPWGPNDPITTKKKIRQNMKLIFNRGVDATPPGNYETGPTCCNYFSYLIRPMCLGKDKVIVLTGKLPAFPHTRNGETTMNAGEVRYFSITHQLGTNTEGNTGKHGTPYGSLMDDEIIPGKENEYIIVYSRKEDRPANARADFGITWQEWGEPSRQSFVLRWMSVMPDWYLPEYAPDQKNVPWEIGAWSEDTYDKSLVGENKAGVMGPYHPVIHYMDKEEFESLGDSIKVSIIPEWTDSMQIDFGEESAPQQDKTDIQEKIKELQKAFRGLREARERKDRPAIGTSLQEVGKIWNNLPEKVRQEIENRQPGITEKIEEIEKVRMSFPPA